MPTVILDWSDRYKKGIITSNFLENIRAYFSVPNEVKKILYRKMGPSARYIPNFVSVITQTGMFDIGMFADIYNYLVDESGIDFEIIVTDKLQQHVIPTQYITPPIVQSLNMELRPYQERSVAKGAKIGYGIFMIGTAGGKTLVMASLIETIRRSLKEDALTIVILPANLVEQTYKEFLSYGMGTENVSRWNGDNNLTVTPIILASSTTLQYSLKTFKNMKPLPLYKWNGTHEEYKQYLIDFELKEKERIKDWKKQQRSYLEKLANVDLLLVDECHCLRRGNELNNVIDLFDTRHRFGFTGTLPDKQLDCWNIIGKMGPVLVDIDSAALRELGYVAPVKAFIFNVHYKNPPEVSIDTDTPASAYNTEIEFLHNNPFRNKLIRHLANNVDKNILILVDRIEHGLHLQKIIKEQTNKSVYFIRGSVEMEDREEMRKLMEKTDNIICIAISKIFSTGINIKNLHYIIFAQSGKAKIRMLQSIGRGLRLHENKDRLTLFDIADMLHYGEDHLGVRLTYYKKEKIDYETKDLLES